MQMYKRVWIWKNPVENMSIEKYYVYLCDNKSIIF